MRNAILLLQAIRGEGTTKSAGGSIKPHSTPSSSAAKLLPDPASSTQQPPADPPAPPGKRSPFAPRFSNGTAPKTPRDPGFQHAAGEVTPHYTVVHQGTRDLAEAWNDPTGRPCKGVPRALVIRITLPGLVSAAPVELDVAATRITAVVPGKYRLELPLPFCVTDDGSAKFNRDSGVLTLSLPVAGPKAASSTAPAGAENALETTHGSQDALALDSCQAGCDERTTGDECRSRAAPPCLVQVLSDEPADVEAADEAQDTPRASDSHTAHSGQEGCPKAVGCESSDEVGSAGVVPAGVQPHAPCLGTVDGGSSVPEGVPQGAGMCPQHGEGGGHVDVETGSIVREELLRELCATKAPGEDDFRPVPLSQRAPAAREHQPLRGAPGGAGCCDRQCSASAEAAAGSPDPPVPCTDSHSVQGEDPCTGWLRGGGRPGCDSAGHAACLHGSAGIVSKIHCLHCCHCTSLLLPVASQRRLLFLNVDMPDMLPTMPLW